MQMQERASAHRRKPCFRLRLMRLGCQVRLGISCTIPVCVAGVCGAGTPSGGTDILAGSSSSSTTSGSGTKVCRVRAVMHLTTGSEGLRGVRDVWAFPRQVHLEARNTPR